MYIAAAAATASVSTHTQYNGCLFAHANNSLGKPPRVAALLSRRGRIFISWLHTLCTVCIYIYVCMYVCTMCHWMRVRDAMHASHTLHIHITHALRSRLVRRITHLRCLPAAIVVADVRRRHCSSSSSSNGKRKNTKYALTQKEKKRARASDARVHAPARYADCVRTVCTRAPHRTRKREARRRRRMRMHARTYIVWYIIP